MYKLEYLTAIWHGIQPQRPISRVIFEKRLPVELVTEVCLVGNHWSYRSVFLVLFLPSLQGSFINDVTQIYTFSKTWQKLENNSFPSQHFRERINVHIRWHLGNLKKTYLIVKILNLLYHAFMYSLLISFEIRCYLYRSITQKTRIASWGVPISQKEKCPECSTWIAAHTEGPTWFVLCNMCNDDWNIDHRRW